MAVPTDSSLIFFQRGTSSQWTYMLSHYKEVLRLHAHKSRSFKKNGPEELIKLDNWFHETLPANIRSRKDKHVTHDELVQITKWKLTRGKNRRQLLDLVRINTELAVKQTTQKAFRKIPNLAAAISALTNLKGIGPQTASAVLCAGFPEHCPYMADECMLSTPGVEATDYTLNEFTNYATQIQSCVDRLNEADPETKWNPHKVEQALWVHYLAKELKPSILESMPLPDGSVRPVIKSAAEEDVSNASDGVTTPVGSSNGNNGSQQHNNSNGGHALDEDSNISGPVSTGSGSGDESKLSNGDEDSRQSVGEFRTPAAAVVHDNNSSSNHLNHLSNHSEESLSNEPTSSTTPASSADDSSQTSASASASGHNSCDVPIIRPVPVTPCDLSLVHDAEEANHVADSALDPSSSICLDEPALKKIRASE